MYPQQNENLTVAGKICIAKQRMNPRFHYVFDPNKILYFNHKFMSDLTSTFSLNDVVRRILE